MKLYADAPLRRSRQMFADAAVLAWIVGWVWLGTLVRDAVVQLRAPADSISGAGVSVRDAFVNVGERIGALPAVGDDLQGWFVQASQSGTTLQQAGADMAGTVERVGLLLAVAVALGPILMALALWLLVRVPFIRTATATQRFIDSGEDLDLFALRALAHQPVQALARVSPDPAGAWRAGDPAVIRELAAIELARQGLRTPSAAAR